MLNPEHYNLIDLTAVTHTTCTSNAIRVHFEVINCEVIN